MRTFRILGSFVMVAVRVLVDPNNPEDVKAVSALQDAIRIGQEGTGRFEVPDWDEDSQKKVREALLVLGATLPDSERMFGAIARKEWHWIAHNSLDGVSKYKEGPGRVRCFSDEERSALLEQGEGFAATPGRDAGADDSRWSGSSRRCTL
jgi:hypothetical protein